MDLLVEIRTPKGEALKTSDRINKMVIPKGAKVKSYVNEDNDIIYWEVTANVRTCMKVSRNIAYYETIITEAFKTSMVKNKLKKLTPEDQATLEDMLKNQTKITIIKTSQIDSKEVEDLKKTWWERQKEKFKLT